MRPRNVYVKFLQCRANATDNLGGPKRLAEQSGPTVFWIANRAEGITGVCGLIGVEAVARKGFLEFGIATLRRTAGTDSESFALKALKELFELRFAGLRKNQAALGRVAVVNFMKLAEFADAIEMAEEINHEKFIRS